MLEKIINLCDLMCANKIMTVDKRLIDIIIRRGANENTSYHIKEVYKLKEYIDSLLGYNVYDLFPEINDLFPNVPVCFLDFSIAFWGFLWYNKGLGPYF